jgi:hypothetical protein
MMADSIGLDEPTDRPPAALDVARRALILSAVVCRASIEGHRDETYRRQTVKDIDQWLDELRLWPHLEPEEEVILRTTLGVLSQRLQIRGTWFAEGLAILSWALCRSEFPPHDRKVDPIDVTNALDFLHPDAEKLLESPKLRDAAELEATREWFYDLHCTLRGFLFHNGDGRLAEWIDRYRAALSLDPKTIRHDGLLQFDGRPLPEAEREQLQEWERIITERHRASIWLMGEYPLYTEVSVDT